MYFLIYCGFLNAEKISSEALARRCSVKKVLLEKHQKKIHRKAPVPEFLF